MVEIDQQVLEDLYSWIDQVPLSRPKKDLKRDFSDGGIHIILVDCFWTSKQWDNPPSGSPKLSG